MLRQKPTCKSYCTPVIYGVEHGVVVEHLNIFNLDFSETCSNYGRCYVVELKFAVGKISSDICRQTGSFDTVVVQGLGRPYHPQCYVIPWQISTIRSGMLRNLRGAQRGKSQLTTHKTHAA